MPKIVDHNGRRNELAAAAVSVIARLGIENMRLVDVARAVGATTGTVTHYLGDKDSVLRAALEYVAAELLAHDDQTGDLESLWQLLFATLPSTEKSRTHWLVWIAFWSRASSNPELSDVHAQYNKKFRESLKRNLQNNLLPAAFATTSAEEMANAIIIAIDGISLHATIEPRAWPAKKQKRQLALTLAPMLGMPNHFN